MPNAITTGPHALAQDYAASPPYQGCGSKIVGTPATLRTELDDLEASGEWIAEPKFDGNWIVVVGHGRDLPPILVNRSGNRPSTNGLPGIAAGLVLVGEYAFGTQAARAEVEQLGHHVVHVFDVLHGPDGAYLGDCAWASRAGTLERLYAAQPDLQESYPLTERWATGFAARFAASAEGIVLKRRDSGAYRSGTRAPDWMKVKKADTYDCIAWSWDPSEAESKAGKGMAGAVHVAQYIKGQPGTDLLPGRLAPEIEVDGAHYGLRDCGKVTIGHHEFCRTIAQDWNGVRGRVIEVSAYQRFESGSFRHPSMVGFRADKSPRECLA